METTRRPIGPTLLSVFLSPVLLTSFAAAQLGVGVRIIKLPGYAATAPELRLPAPRLETAYPSTQKIFGGSTDPLDSLVSADEDLRDSLNSIPPGEALQIGLRNASVPVRLAAVRASAWRRDIAAIPPLSGVMLRLDQPAPLRAAAALALGTIGDFVAVPSLSEALKDPSPNVRYAAALSLGLLPADGVVTRLERLLRTDPSWGPRYAAAISLGRTRKPFAAGPLAEALATDPAWQVRQQAARSLADLGTEHAADALAAALNDPEPTVRAAAGAGLAEIGKPVHKRAMMLARSAEPDASVRAVLAVAEASSPFR
ncbi:MAG: HEAT repeat domain-containing protein [Elusimicrobiota bacterium]